MHLCTHPHITLHICTCICASHCTSAHHAVHLHTMLHICTSHCASVHHITHLTMHASAHHAAHLCITLCIYTSCITLHFCACASAHATTTRLGLRGLERVSWPLRPQAALQRSLDKPCFEHHCCFVTALGWIVFFRHETKPPDPIVVNPQSIDTYPCIILRVIFVCCNP